MKSPQSVTLIILIAALYLALGFITPWWILFVVAGVVGIFCLSARQAWWCGFFGVGVVWLILGFYLDQMGEGRVSSTLAGLFALPWPVLIYIPLALTGAFLGGSAGWLSHRLVTCFNVKRFSNIRNVEHLGDVNDLDVR